LRRVKFPHRGEQARDAHTIKIIRIDVSRHVQLYAIDYVPDQRKIALNQFFLIDRGRRGDLRHSTSGDVRRDFVERTKDCGGVHRGKWWTRRGGGGWKMAVDFGTVPQSRVAI
jgi:hypothetical protein